MDLNLDGRVALITGASEGIGKATALSLAQEGCRVGMCARRPDVLEAAAEEVRAATGAEVLALPTDVTRPDQIERAVQTIGREFGPVYILVNNAGQSAAAPFDAVGDDVWAAD
jgi:3-oxoacyl-[acyl-carrier protein] reductase